MVAPLSHEEPEAGSIDVGLMRILSTEPTGRQLWYLAGGPGGAGTSLLPLLHGAYGAAWQGADFYALDHRGTGRTERLSCPDQEAPGSPGDTLLAPDEVAPCVATLEREHGDRLQHLTIEGSVRDLAAAIERTRGDDSVMLWGNSYGTHWAFRFADRFPQAVDGVFVEALVPPSYSYRAFDQVMNDAGMRLMERCAQTPTCRERFATDPQQLARDMPARLRSGHCAALQLPVPVSWFLGSQLYDHGLRDMIPMLVFMLDRCSERDVARLQQTYRVLFRDQGMLTAGDFCAPAHVHVVLSELWHGGPARDRTVPQVSEQCLFCPADRASLDRARPLWPTYEAPSLGPARYEGPLWMLQGSFDPGVSLAEVGPLRERYRGPHQHLIEFPAGAHTLIGNTPAPKADCALDLLHAFVDDPQADPPSCAGEVTGPTFVLGATRLTEALMGEGDPWAG